MGGIWRAFGRSGEHGQRERAASPAPAASSPAATATTPLKARVAVVGAGLAGLMAARRLVAAGVDDVLVLEARDRVGGRVYTQRTADGTPVDLGAQWIGPTQRRMLALAAEFGIGTFKTYDTGQNIEMRAGSRGTYSGPIPTSDPTMSGDVVEALLNLTMMAAQVPPDAPWTAPQSAAWDAQTAATWIEANVQSEGARQLVTLAVQAVFSAEPRDLSLLHLLFYINAAGGLMDLIGVTGGAQETRFTDGAQQVALRLAAALGQRVRLGTPIWRVAQDAVGVRLEGDDIAVEAERAIIALPPVLAGRLRYAPALPGPRDQLTQRVPMGTVIKVHCVYETPFWRAEGLSGQVSSDAGPVRITFDNSPEAGSPGILLGFIEGDEGRAWGARPAAERRAAVLECLAGYFGAAAARPSEYIEQSWAEEEFTRGCYAGYMPTGVWTTYGAALREPIGRLHWAGTETATNWNGYMEGALQSGERAADEVLAAFGQPGPTP